jgi:hypothetical protein
MSTWIVSFLFKLVPDSIFPEFGKKKHSEDEKNASGVKRQSSSFMNGNMRGAFRQNSKQGSLRPQNSDRQPIKAGSQKKQPANQHLDVLDMDSK